MVVPVSSDHDGHIRAGAGGDPIYNWGEDGRDGECEEGGVIL